MTETIGRRRGPRRGLRIGYSRRACRRLEARTGGAARGVAGAPDGDAQRRAGTERGQRRLHRGTGDARREATYNNECSSCHGAGLEGDGFAPALAGTEFLSNWNGTTLGDLFDRIRISMPPGSPASVPPQSKADIVAHLLKSNKYPAGKTEIGKELEPLKLIKIELPK